MIASLSSLMLLAACQPHVTTQAQPRNDVLVIVADDLGTSELPLMPNVQALAARGTYFSRAYSWPVCSPTRYAAMFGELPRRAGIGNVISAHNPTAPNSSPAPQHSKVSLAEALLPSHRTCLVGKWHLGRASNNGTDLLALTESGPFTSGFADWLAGSPVTIAAGPSSTGYYDWYMVRNEIVAVSYNVYATDEQRAQFQEWWTTHDGGHPRFCWLAFSAPHAPFNAPPGYGPAPNERAAYEQVVRYLDGAIGEVLAGVDLSRTYVVFFGDNGTPDQAPPPPAPRGFWKGTTYEGGIRVPLIVAGPGIAPRPDHPSPRLVSVVDIPATLLELLGTGSRGFTDSHSFADELGPAWEGEAPRTFVFAERYDVAAGEQPPGYEDVALVEKAWKWRRWDQDGDGPEGFQEALYYLPGDPFEQSPIDPALVPAVALRFQAHLATLPPRRP